MDIQDHTINTSPLVHEHHPDDDKDKTPSPKIEKKISIGRDVGGIRASFSRSEEDLFSDAVTEFSDSATSQGSVHKTLDRDLFYSFNDAENGGTKDVLNTPIEISKANLEVSKEKILETEITKVELTDTEGQRSDSLVKGEAVDPTPEQSLVSESQETESVVVSAEEKDAESQNFETVTEETKNSDISKRTPEVSAVSEFDQNILPVTKKDDFGEPKEQIVEVVNEPVTVLSEIKDLEASESEKVPKELIQETVEKHTDEVVEKPDSLLTKSQDLGVPILDKRSEEIVVDPVPVLTESRDVIAPELEKCSKEISDEVIEQKDVDVNIVNIVVADVNDETITQKDSSKSSVANDKTASGVAEPFVEETNSKLINNVAFSVDSGSRNSLEGNWGSVSVLSTASIDTESLQTTEKSKVNHEKSTPSVTHSPPEGKDEKSTSPDARDLKQPLTKVNIESEVRNKNEEAIEKVTNWTATGKQSTALKNLLDDNVDKNEDNVVNEDVNSPPKLIDEGRNGKKKMKAKSSWMPFVCCCSKNVVN